MTGSSSLGNLEALQARLAIKQGEVEEIQGLILELRAGTEVECKSCNGVFKIKDVVFVQTHYYEHPHGCMGGDTWHASKDGHWGCPTCNRRNSLYGKPEITSLKGLFKSVIDKYDR